MMQHLTIAQYSSNSNTLREHYIQGGAAGQSLLTNKSHTHNRRFFMLNEIRKQTNRVFLLLGPTAKLLVRSSSI